MSKTMGSMNLEEFLKDYGQSTGIGVGIGIEGSDGLMSDSLGHQGSLGLSGNISEKIADEVWRELQKGEKIKDVGLVKREGSMGAMTLESFLAKQGAIEDSSLSSLMPLDIPATSQCFSHQMVGLSPAPATAPVPSPSVGAMPDTPVSGRKREPPETFNGIVEKKLRRKIKNRESAARSRAIKQAYHNELVSKVSRLEEQNMMLKKEKEVEKRFTADLVEPKYQLRRTCSAIP